MKNPFRRSLQWVQNLTIFCLFEISQQIWLLEVSKISAKMGCGWQADWAMAKIFFSNLRKHEMNKCWKFQADILIHVWFRAKRLKICCNQWTPKVHQGLICTLGVHWLQQIFSLLALNQTWIKISAWNFQHLFISCLRKIEKKILAVTQSACQPRPISAETLDASSNHICWDIWKRKKLVRFWTHWSNLLKGFWNIS